MQKSLSYNHILVPVLLGVSMILDSLFFQDVASNLYVTKYHKDEAAESNHKMFY